MTTLPPGSLQGPAEAPAACPLHRRAWVGLGANLGDARATLQQALLALGSSADVQLGRVSSFWRSAPVDAQGPEFINACAELRTALPPLELLALLQRIEQLHGRQRPYRNAPRTLDLDLLACEGETWCTPELTLPHPRLHLRAFVLRPLAEIVPVLPGLGPLAPWLQATADQDCMRLP